MIRTSTSDRGLSKTGVSAFHRAGLLLSVRRVFSTTIFVLILNVGTGLITARVLGPEGRGELAAIMLWPGLVAGLFTLGLQPAITYTLASQREDAPCVILVGLVLTLCAGVLAAAFGIVAVPIWLEGYSIGVVNFTQWVILIVPVFLLLRSANAILQAYEDFKLYNRNLYVRPVVSIVALSILAVYGFLDPFTAALAIMIPSLPLLVVNLWWIVRTHRPRLREPARSIRVLLSYGLRSYGKDVIATLAKEVDRIVLIGLVNPAALGLYVVAKSLARPTVALPTAVVTVLFPAASRIETKDAVTLLARAARISTVFACTLGLGLAFAAPPLLELLYGAAFSPSVAPFRILLIDSILLGLSSILAQAFMSSGRPGVETALRAVSFLVSVLGMLLLVPVFGLSGAALALLISTLVRLSFLLSCFPLLLKVRIPSLLPGMQDVEWLWSRWRERSRMSTVVEIVDHEQL